VAELGQVISEDFDRRPLVILGVTALCHFLSNSFEFVEGRKSYVKFESSCRKIEEMMSFAGAPWMSESSFSASLPPLHFLIFERLCVREFIFSTEVIEIDGAGGEVPKV
jgi:hypothetical protein